MTDVMGTLQRRLDELLAEMDPASTPARDLRARQYDLGLAWVHFPEGFGGLGQHPRYQHVVDVCLRAAGAAPAAPQLFIALTLAGPTVAAHGSTGTKRARLRSMFTGVEVWCQLFSEPGAGSDLAGLATRAVRDGDEWVITGQKVWSTLAHLADRGLLLARSDPHAPKHKGLTYFGLDMHAPGVEVRPVRQLTGEAEFNEVYLTEVRVPDSDRIGDVGDGWRVAMTTLANERTTIGVEEAPAPGSGAIAEAVRIWSEEAINAGRVARDSLARAWIAAEALRLTNVRGSEQAAGSPGPQGSIAKLGFAETNMAIYDLCVDLLGPHALAGYDYAMRRPDNISFVGRAGTARQMFLRSRANSIEGGTSEIQRTILGEQVLGLPGDLRVDKGIPWSRVPRG